MNTPVTKCTFALPGTWGHECGSPATHVGVFKSKVTRNGIYFAGRCESCLKIKGGENAGVERFEPVGPQHINKWK